MLAWPGSDTAMRFIRMTWVVVAGLVTLIGCGGTDDPVDGKAYLLGEATGIDSLQGAPLRLEFSDGSVGVTGGCNLIGGAYEVDGDTLIVETMMQTEMACEEPRMDQDAAIIEFLQARPEIAVNGTVLTLSEGERTTTWDAVPPLDG